MQETVQAICPYCSQSVEVDVDPDTQGRLVQDCEVCCHPWEVYIERDPDGTPYVTLMRAQ
jgi:hypothetical protein